MGGPVTIIMWGAQPGWKLALNLILLPRVSKVTLIYFTLQISENIVIQISEDLVIQIHLASLAQSGEHSLQS